MICHSLVQLSVFFKKTKNTPSIRIYFRFKTATKEMLVFFQKRLEKSLIWTKSSATWESSFKR